MNYNRKFWKLLSISKFLKKILKNFPKAKQLKKLQFFNISSGWNVFQNKTISNTIKFRNLTINTPEINSKTQKLHGEKLIVFRNYFCYCFFIKVEIVYSFVTSFFARSSTIWDHSWCVTSWHVYCARLRASIFCYVPNRASPTTVRDVGRWRHHLPTFACATQYTQVSHLWHNFIYSPRVSFSRVIHATDPLLFLSSSRACVLLIRN